MSAPVALVGGGPGDPGLLTLRAEAQLLAAAIVIADRPLLEVAAARAPQARLVMIEGGASAVTELLASVAASAGPIVRLYRGDTWLHPAHRVEAAALRAAGVAVEAVPGVATEVALPALAGVPLHARPLAVTATLAASETVPPPDDPARTLVVSTPDLRAAAARLLAAARPGGGTGPAALVSPAGSVERGALAGLSAGAPVAPGLLVTGAVCALDTRGSLDTRGGSGAVSEPGFDEAGRAGLRTGWTTGTCASAAAKAALSGLLSGQAPAEVEVGLPDGRRVTFPVEPAAVGDAPNRCVVVKDAGDDPDCTDGARMTAIVDWASGPSTELRAGPGIGVVTRPGLGLPLGQPSITDVPRRMILAALAEVSERPVVATFSVPGGEDMAARTSNQRLGIVGGISILGTTGVVKPFSTAAYRASVVQQIDVAAAQGMALVVLATGTRSDEFAQRRFPDLDPVCFVEVGDFTGVALRRCAADGVRQVCWIGMAGKLTKLAAGVMMTHFRSSKVDTDLLAAVARESGASEEVVAAATATSTARHFFEVCLSAGETEPWRRLCERAAAACRAHVGDPGFDVEVVCTDFDGTREVARA